MSKPPKRTPATDKAIRLAGGESALSRKLGITRQAVNQWETIPPSRVVEVERITGVPRWELLPELFRPTNATLPENASAVEQT